MNKESVYGFLKMAVLLAVVLSIVGYGGDLAFLSESPVFSDVGDASENASEGQQEVERSQLILSTNGTISGVSGQTVTVRYPNSSKLDVVEAQVSGVEVLSENNADSFDVENSSCFETVNSEFDSFVEENLIGETVRVFPVTSPDGEVVDSRVGVMGGEGEDDRFMSVILVENGYGKISNTSSLSENEQDVLTNAQDSAQANNIGVWECTSSESE